MRKAHAEGAASATQPVVATVITTSTLVAPVEKPPKHPLEPAKGPRHTVLGSIHDVACESPSYLELQVQVAGKTKPIALYIGDYYKLDLTAQGFQPKSEMNPCRDLDGMKAKILYAETSDKTIDGQIVAIELHK
jgi:hypothetical protein